MQSISNYMILRESFRMIVNEFTISYRYLLCFVLNSFSYNLVAAKNFYTSDRQINIGTETRVNIFWTI